MNNIIIDINNFETELENLLLSKKITYDNKSAKYFIYSLSNKNSEDELSNVIIKIPPIRLLYNYSHQNFNQINFPLNPTYSKTKKFVSLVGSLENYLQELLNKPKLEWVTNIKKIKYVKNIKLNYFGKNNIKIITNSEDIRDIKDFEAGSEVEIMVHLSHLWLKDKRVGISYDICQIKYTSIKSILENNFFSPPKQVKSENRRIRETNYRQSNNKPVQRSLSFMIPSKEVLEEQKSKLKKINV
tara:strand:- start:489 stop:1217 length:729 start_codon:yes stop_codon:yes gene_type:complete